MSTEPPRLALWLLRGIASPSTRELVRQDLDEEFREHIAPRRTGRDARAWYLRMAWRSLLAQRLTRRLAGVADSFNSNPRPRTMSELGQDLRHTIRVIRRAPLMSTTVLVTVAAAVAAAVAIGSVVQSVLLNPLPFPAPERLVRIERAAAGQPSPFGVVGYPDMQAWGERSRAFEAIAGWSGSSVTLSAPGQDPVRLRVARTSPGMDRVLGVGLQRGRHFLAGEFEFGAHRVVLVSDAFWRASLGSDPAVLDRALTLDGVDHQIVGVLEPQSLAYPSGELWLPMALAADAWQLRVRGASWMTALGRVRSGVTMATAGDEMSTIQAALVQEFPRQNENQDSIVLTPLRDVIVGDTRTTLALLAAAVLAVLLVASANVGILLATQAARRRPEFGLRAALGARRARLVRQLLTESVVLATAGGVLGAVASPVLIRQIVGLYPGGLPRAGEVGVDGLVLTLAASLVAFLGVVVGGVCASYALRAQASAVGVSLRTSTEGRGMLQLRSALAGVQVAVAVVALAFSALFVATLNNLNDTDPGFRVGDVLTFNLSLPAARYDSDAKINAFADEFLRQLREVPGVFSAGASTAPPFGGAIWGGGYATTGGGDAVQLDAMVRVAWPGTYDALGVPTINGRVFDQRDSASAARVVLLNQRAAGEAFPGLDPIGRTIYFNDEEWQVIGVLRDIRHAALGTEPQPELHVPAQQLARDSFTVVVHHAPGSEIVEPIRALVRSQDPGLPISALRTMDERIQTTLAAERFRATLIGGLGGTALLLALVGVYGVVATGVQQRRREIAVRMALGDTESGVVRRVLSGAARLAVGGALVGAALVLAAGTRVAPYLYGIEASDARVALGVPLLLVLFAVLSALPAALLAARTDPLALVQSE